MNHWASEKLGIHVALIGSAVIFGTMGAYKMTTMAASSKPCALDLMICTGGGRAMIALIIPMIVLFDMILVMNYRFQYRYIVKSRKREQFLAKILVAALGVTSVFALISMFVMLAIGMLFFGSICNYNDISSLFRDELNTTGTQFPVNLSVIILIIKATTVNIMEVYSRVLIGIMIYFLFNKGWAALIVVIGTSMLIPFRMKEYLEQWQFKPESGAFYTELLQNDLYQLAVTRSLILIAVMLLMLLIIIRRKSFYQT